MVALGVGEEIEGVGSRGLMKKRVSGFSLFEKGMDDSVCFVHLRHPSDLEQKHGSCTFGRHHL